MTIKTLSKHSLVAAGFLTILAVTPVMAFAQTVSPITKQAQITNKIPDIKAKGDNLINDRITKLTSFKNAIDARKRLSATQKQQYDTSITAAITNLNTLKTKIDADTDVATLKTDIKSIFTSYRIYAVVVPQIAEQAAADAMSTSADQLGSLADKLQARITEASNKGNDVTSLNSLLSDMRAKIADAKTQYANADSLISGLTPASFNSDQAGTKNTFMTARTDIKTGRQDLQTALQDAKNIRNGLKALKPSGSPVTSASPTK